MERSAALPSCVVDVPGAGQVLLLPGDLIGRSEAATLVVDDPRVSEVHAYVSLRGGQLVLLGLRGRLGLDGQIVTEVVLAPGQRIALARDFEIAVRGVTLPDRVLALEGDGLPRQILAGTCALVLDPEPSLAPGYFADAPLQLWRHGERWRARAGKGDATTVEPGQSWRIAGRTFTAVTVHLHDAGARPTASTGRLESPLHLVARYDSVHIARDGEVALVLGGRAAQLVSELVAFAGPVYWSTLAGEIWGSNEDPQSLRAKLDVTLRRLRDKLAASDLRRDLVRNDGSGNVELVLQPGDTVSAEL